MSGHSLWTGPWLVIPTGFLQTLSQTEALVLAVVALYQEDMGGYCAETMETFADRLGMAGRTARRNLQSLTEAGWIEDVTPEHYVGPNRYRLTDKAWKLVFGGLQNDAPNETPSAR